MNAHPLDPSDFRQMILDSPDQFRTGFELASGIRLEGEFTSAMVSGMGGSALPAGLLRAYLADIAAQGEGKALQIFQNRSYGIPREGYSSCLHFICSYSGNTEETLEVFEQALRAKLPMVGMSGGGRLEELCREHAIPHIKLPVPSPNFQPRMGTGYFFAALLQVLINQGLAPDTREKILAEAEQLKTALPRLEEAGKALAERLAGKTPVIYASSAFQALAMVWKIKLNENAKTPAFWNFFPELNHNEMVGFSLPQAKFFILMLRDPDDHPRNRKRYEITAELLREKGIETEILDMEGEGVYSKIFTSIALGDFSSYFLALKYGQDPTPVNMVEKLKKLLA